MLKSLWLNGKQLTLPENKPGLIDNYLCMIAGIPSNYFKSLLQTTFAVLEDVMCQTCMVPVAVLRCQDCGKNLCHGCDSSIHDFAPFNDRDAIVNGHIVPIPSTTSQNSIGEWVTVGKCIFFYFLG